MPKRKMQMLRSMDGNRLLRKALPIQLQQLRLMQRRNLLLRGPTLRKILRNKRMHKQLFPKRKMLKRKMRMQKRLQRNWLLRKKCNSRNYWRWSYKMLSWLHRRRLRYQNLRK
jgi:hypothetical protein